MTAEAGILKPSTSARPGEAERAAAPVWLDILVQWAALGVVAVALVGMPLLLVGLFKSYLVLPGAIVVWLVLMYVRGRARPSSSARVSWTTHVVSGFAVLAAAADFLANARRATQHLLVDGDPAVYGMTGKWIAQHGTLNIPIHPEWFGHDQTINYMTNGFFMRPDEHHLYPQFFHLLPALLAVGDWFDGTRALLHLSMLLGAFSLLAIYAFATRFMPPIWALATMVTLAMTLPQLFFSQDTFSEIPSQFLIFAGLAMLYGAGRSSCRLPGAYGLLAGLTIGASTMARIDAFMYIPPVLAAVVVLTLAVARDDPRFRAWLRVTVGVAVGLAVTALIGVADAAFGSPEYAKSVTGELIAVFVVTVVVVAVGALVLAHRGAGSLAVRVGRFLPRLAPYGGGLLSVAFFFAWLLRPYVQKTHEMGVLDVSATIASYQKAEGVPIDPTRHYNEMSLRWMSWYIGPIALTLAILGIGYLTYRMMRGRDLRLLPFFLLAGSATAVYVYDPSIVPVQYWAMRRYVPVTFPLLLLLAFFLLHRVFAAAWRHRISAVRWVGAVATTGLGIATLATPIVLLQGPPRLVHAYLPMEDVVNRICHALQPSDTVLLVAGAASGYTNRTNGFVQTIETYCGNAAAVAGIHTERANIVQMAQAAAASGHRLMLIGDDPTVIDNKRNPVGITLGTNLDSVVFATEAQSLTHRPNAVFAPTLHVWIGPAPLG